MKQTTIKPYRHDADEMRSYNSTMSSQHLTYTVLDSGYRGGREAMRTAKDMAFHMAEGPSEVFELIVPVSLKLHRLSNR
jgi:hypothetical protein